MGTIKKMHGILGLFLVLVIVLVISPKTIKNVYDTILGRFTLIGIIVFFTIHNVTLGLLVALIVIISSNMFLFEGHENMPVIDGTKNVVIDSKYVKHAKDAKDVKDVHKKVDEGGVDKITIQESIKSTDSKSLPVPTGTSSEDVVAKEGLTIWNPSSV